MFLYRFIKVCAVLVLVCITLISAKNVKCRLCDAARSLDDCVRSVTCDPDEECYMDEVVTEQLTIEYTAGCRAKDVCSSAISTIGKRGINKRADFIACSRCCDIASVDGKECNTKLCGIKLLQQNSSQCYFCDSAKSGGQGDVSSPTQCGSLTTCQTDEVCGAETFALAQNVTHRKTCLPRRICTLLTQKALEDVKRCKDPASVAAGLCGNKKRAGNMVCSACCGDAVCNGDSCEDILERLYNLWTANVLNLYTLKATGKVPQGPSQASSVTSVTISNTKGNVPISPSAGFTPIANLSTTVVTSFPTRGSITSATRSPPQTNSVIKTTSFKTTHITTNPTAVSTAFQATTVMPTSSTSKPFLTTKKLATTFISSTKLFSTSNKVKFTASPNPVTLSSSVSSSSTTNSLIKATVSPQINQTSTSFSFTNKSAMSTASTSNLNSSNSVSKGLKPFTPSIISSAKPASTKVTTAPIMLVPPTVSIITPTAKYHFSRSSAKATRTTKSLSVSTSWSSTGTSNDRLYNLWVGNVLDFKTLKTTGTLSTTKVTAPSTAPTVPTTKPTTPSTRATTPSTKATTPSTRATTPSTKATTPSTRATTPSTKATTPSTRATTPSTRATTKPTTPSTRATTKPTTPSTRATTKPTTPSTTATTKVSITTRVTNVTSNVPTPSTPPATAATNGSSGSPLPAGVTAG